MISKARIAVLCVFAVVAAPAAAQADNIVAADPAAQSVAALDGTVVWVSGAFGAQVLMQKTGAGVARVKGAPTAKAYRSIDLGRDRQNKLVLTYLRCESGGRCVARADDLAGHRSSIPGLSLTRCSLTTAPALWRTRAAYGLECRKRGTRTLDTKRSGLYMKTGSGTPRRLPLPADAVRYGIRLVDAVDLRGTRVAAIAADIYEYAFSQTVNGTQRQSFLAAASEGDGNENATGVSLGTGSVLWTLVDSEHVGDPNRAVIYRLAGSCRQSEALVNDPGPDQESGFRATDLVVDGETLYLVVPQTGIVTHGFVPERAC